MGEYQTLPTKDNLIKLIKNNLREFNLLRIENNYELLDLSDANLSGLTLRDVNFNNIDVSYANFSNCDIDSTDFSNSKLFNTSFKGSNINSTDFSNSDLNSADFSNTKIKNTILDEASLIDAVLNNAFIEDCSLNKTNLLHSNLCNANISSIDLQNTFNLGKTIYNDNTNWPTEDYLPIDFNVDMEEVPKMVRKTREVNIEEPKEVAMQQNKTSKETNLESKIDTLTSLVSSLTEKVDALESSNKHKYETNSLIKSINTRIDSIEKQYNAITNQINDNSQDQSFVLLDAIKEIQLNQKDILASYSQKDEDQLKKITKEIEKQLHTKLESIENTIIQTNSNVETKDELLERVDQLVTHIIEVSIDKLADDLKLEIDEKINNLNISTSINTTMDELADKIECKIDMIDIEGKISSSIDKLTDQLNNSIDSRESETDLSPLIEDLAEKIQDNYELIHHQYSNIESKIGGISNEKGSNTEADLSPLIQDLSEKVQDNYELIHHQYSNIENKIGDLTNEKASHAAMDEIQELIQSSITSKNKQLEDSIEIINSSLNNKFNIISIDNRDILKHLERLIAFNHPRHCEKIDMKLINIENNSNKVNEKLSELYSALSKEINKITQLETTTNSTQLETNIFKIENKINNLYDLSASITDKVERFIKASTELESKEDHKTLKSSLVHMFKGLEKEINNSLEIMQEATISGIIDSNNRNVNTIDSILEDILTKIDHIKYHSESKLLTKADVEDLFLSIDDIANSVNYKIDQSLQSFCKTNNLQSTDSNLLPFRDSLERKINFIAHQIKLIKDQSNENSYETVHKKLSTMEKSLKEDITKTISNNNITSSIHNKIDELENNLIQKIIDSYLELTNEINDRKTSYQPMNSIVNEVEKIISLSILNLKKELNTIGQNSVDVERNVNNLQKNISLISKNNSLVDRKLDEIDEEIRELARNTNKVEKDKSLETLMRFMERDSNQKMMLMTALINKSTVNYQYTPMEENYYGMPECIDEQVTQNVS